MSVELACTSCWTEGGPLTSHMHSAVTLTDHGPDGPETAVWSLLCLDCEARLLEPLMLVASRVPPLDDAFMDSVRQAQRDLEEDGASPPDRDWILNPPTAEEEVELYRVRSMPNDDEPLV